MAQYSTYGELMQAAFAGVWPDALFSMMVQTMPRLQPRYFSISSSPIVSGRKVSLTAGVVVTDSANKRFHGLATNYLYALHSQYRGISLPESYPRFPLKDINAQVLVRSSSFRLPEPCRPIIMVAAGSGIAPFRAFVHEREALANAGHDVGRSLLFFGCRSPDEHLYAEEWSQLEREHDFFSMDTAFSRVGSKEYVQHRFTAREERVLDLLDDHASLYLCGSVNMARDVKKVLADALVRRGHTRTEANDFLTKLKSEKRLQEDVWA